MAERSESRFAWTTSRPIPGPVRCPSRWPSSSTWDPWPPSCCAALPPGGPSACWVCGWPGSCRPIASSSSWLSDGPGAARLPRVIAEPPGAAPSERARRHGGRPGIARLDPRVLVLAVTGLGAADFLWRLGSSSYFVDEVLSLQHALSPLGTATGLVSRTETTPWTFFWGLHVWLHLTGSQSEWVARLPSALAGVALVPAVYWRARAFADRPAALLTGALTALSPLVLTYAQQVRVYVFALLGLVLAVGLTARAVFEAPHRVRRLVLGGMAAVLALWLHYTAALVVVRLCVWLATRRELPRRFRAGFVGACLVGALIELPLFIHQDHYAPNGGIGATGALTGLNATRVLETPFDGRFIAPVNALRIIGLLALAISVITLACARGRVRASRLLLALGITAPVVILILGAVGKDLVITRYTVVAAPMLLTAIAVAVSLLPRAAAAAVMALGATAAIWGVIVTQRRAGFDPPA